VSITCAPTGLSAVISVTVVTLMPFNRRALTVVQQGTETRFESIASAAKTFGKTPHIVVKRLLRGWSPEAALGLAPPPPKPPHYRCKAVVVCDGGTKKQYASLKDAAAVYGVPHRLAARRLTRKKWSVEQALGLRAPPAKKLPSNARPVSVWIDGRRVRFKSIGQASRQFGVRPALALKRWKVFGWPLEEALGLVPHERRHVGRSKHVSFIHKGKRYRYASIFSAAEDHGVDYSNVLSRLDRFGWTIQQALELVPPPRHSKACYGYIYVVTHRASGRQYVGQTLLSVTQRWEEHVRGAATASPEGKHFCCAIRKYGRRAFDVTEVAHTKSFHDANALEREWIKNLDTMHPRGFNLTRGGSGLNLGRPLQIGGVRYPSIAEAARALGQSPGTVSARLRDSGWTVEQAFGLATPPRRSGARYALFVADGDRETAFGSISAAAEAYGLKYCVVRSRYLVSRWTIEQALGIVPPPARRTQPGRQFSFTWKGRRFSYRSLKEASTHYSVDARIAGARINKLGWTYAEAFGLVERPKAKPNRASRVRFVHKGKRYRYDSILQAARAHGIKGPTVAARIRDFGWSYAQALGLDDPPYLPQRPDCAIAIVHRGRTLRFNSVSHAAGIHGLNPGTVGARIRSGYSIQQALNLSPPPLRGRWVG
jgi:hypothetical protein